jgi:thioester reductase-like protein
VHILNAYRARKDVAKIYCLVRDNFLRRVTQTVAHQKVDKALKDKGFLGLDGHKGMGTEVIALSIKFQERNLGLDDSNYEQLAAEATIIAHVAWDVNFRMSLKSFEYDSLCGSSCTFELIRRNQLTSLQECKDSSTLPIVVQDDSLPYWLSVPL